MNIREAAERSGISAHTIRFYEKSGLLPVIRRSHGGIRNFTESDVTFLKFIAALRQTGLPLSDIGVFMADGCILERLQNREMPMDAVEKRVAILHRHRLSLIQQRQEIDQLIDAVNQKLSFYEDYLNSANRE